MRVLLTGGTGFIGAALRERLLQAGHEVLCVGRHAPEGPDPCSQWRALDFAEARTPGDWTPLLGGVEAVVNAVGIFRETRAQRFDALHAEAPCALFRACAAVGVRRVVQVSALGADAEATTAYHRSKHIADRCLLGLPVEGIVVQPSLVFGAEGTSSRTFLMLATLPLWALPQGGRQPVQPVHRDDVADAIVALLAAPLAALPPARCLPLVGPQPLSFADYLQALRANLGLPPAWVLPLPRRWADALARVGDHVPGALFNRDAWRMLQRGNTAPAAPLTQLLGRPPRAPARFVAPGSAALVRQEAQLRWLLPLARAALAFVWLWTALVSFGLYPVEQSHALLARAGVPPALQPLALYGAALLDLVLGVLTLWPVGPKRWQLPSRRAVWLAQAALMLGYTIVISLRLPEQWLHPYGPISKNVPMLALLLMLHVFEQARSLRRRLRQ
jgi:uncharacterized protein YbjT (DUF2867 family)